MEMCSSRIPNPFFTVIVTTLNRCEMLSETLRTLNAASKKASYEILVIDQSDSDLARVNAEICTRENANYIYSSQRGCVINQNYAALRASGLWLVFFDDDMLFQCDVLGEYTDTIRKYPEYALIAGRTREKREFVVEPEYGVGTFHPTSGKPIGQFHANLPDPVEICHFKECNVAIRRDVFLSVNGFDENFTGNAFFYGVEFGLRLSNIGHRMLYQPRVAAYHLQAPSGGNRVTNSAKWWFWYYRNLTYIIRKYYRPVFKRKHVTFCLWDGFKEGLKKGPLVWFGVTKGVFAGIKMDLKGRTAV